MGCRNATTQSWKYQNMLSGLPQSAQASVGLGDGAKIGEVTNAVSCFRPNHPRASSINNAAFADRWRQSSHQLGCQPGLHSQRAGPAAVSSACEAQLKTPSAYEVAGECRAFPLANIEQAMLRTCGVTLTCHLQHVMMCLRAFPSVMQRVMSLFGSLWAPNQMRPDNLVFSQCAHELPDAPGNVHIMALANLWIWKCGCSHRQVACGEAALGLLRGCLSRPPPSRVCALKLKDGKCCLSKCSPVLFQQVLATFERPVHCVLRDVAT